MGNTTDIRATSETIFQLGVDGPQLKNNLGVVEVVDDEENLIPIRAASPVNDNDVVIKSFVVDNVKSGILQWTIVGPTFEGTTLDGLRIAPFSGYIDIIYVSLAERGGDGNTIVDIKKGAANLANPGDYFTGVSLSSIWGTNPGNKPTLPGNGSNKTQNIILRAYQPDTTVVNKGDVFSFDLTQRTASSRDLVVSIFLKKT